MFAQDLIAEKYFPASRVRLACAGLFIVLFLSSLPVFAEPGRFSIVSADAWSDEDGWYLDAQSEIKLSSGAREALDNGVPLVFELQAQLIRTHTWLWDSIAAEIRHDRQLQFHALSDSYIVRDLDTGTHGIYGRLDDALAALGLIEDMLLTDAVLDQGSKYKLRVRGSHDIESLPTPVRLLAYVSADWDMSSDWYTWTLNR